METILLQEADDDIKDIVSEALKMQGYQVCCIESGKGNLPELVRRHRPRLLLLDCWLTRFSRDICRQLKTHFPQLTIVAFSSDTDIDKRFRDLGFDGYLSKPFELEELYTLVRKNRQRAKATKSFQTT